MKMTSERPVLLLDIDGVLNLFPHFLEDRVTRQTQRQSALLSSTQKQPYSLDIPLDAADLVDQLADYFELHWYTMWNEHARAVFTPLAGIRQQFDHFECDWVGGLDALNATDTPEWMRKAIWVAKTPLIPEHVGDRPFVWVDDDTTPVDSLWLEAHPEVGEFLLITVEPHSGLTQDTVNEAIAWAQSLALKEEVAS